MPAWGFLFLNPDGDAQTAYVVNIQPSGGVHLSFLFTTTIAVNLLALVLTIWLGLYLVSRSPRYTIAWLTALSLWFMSAVFLNTLIAVYPPVDVLRPGWLKFLLPFWPLEEIAGNHNEWLQGWSVVPALALWHHVTILLLPGRTTTWRWVRIFTGYLVAIAAIVVQMNVPILFASGQSDPLFLNTLQAGPWYPIFIVGLVMLISICLFNLVAAARHSHSKVARKQLLVLTWATLVSGLAGLVSIPGSYFGMRIPLLALSVFEAIPVFLIGFGVARYSALVDGRIIQNDFKYSLSLLGFVMIVYIPISWIMIKVYNAPPVIMVVFPTLAVVTHSSMTAIDRLRDRIFYTHETHKLRVELRKLSRLVGVSAPVEELLEPSLGTLCDSVEADYGLIILFEDQISYKLVAWHINEELPDLDLKKLLVDDVVKLPPAYLPSILDKASLLVPLYGGTDQLGALILGEPENGLQYAPEDIESILEFTDQISETIQNAHHNAQYISQIAELVQSQSKLHDKLALPVSAVCIEDALRDLYDYSELADNPLAELSLVQSCLPEGNVTHLERGKAVHAILMEAIEKLRPAAASPSNPPPREWYPYLILRDAYIEETSNRDIMLKLYISEGTFNRTRRAAVRSLARAIGEMETAIE